MLSAPSFYVKCVFICIFNIYLLEKHTLIDKFYFWLIFFSTKNLYDNSTFLNIPFHSYDEFLYLSLIFSQILYRSIIYIIFSSSGSIAQLSVDETEKAVELLINEGDSLEITCTGFESIFFVYPEDEPNVSLYIKKKKKKKLILM